MNTGRNLISFILYILHLRKPKSQTSIIERQLISKYASGKTLAVEIGVYEGLNTCLIAKSLVDKGKLYGIDPFFRGKLGVSYSKMVSKRNIERNKLTSKIRLVEKMSYDAYKDVPDNIDFIFIDGDHSYSGLKKDWDVWLPKVKSGGIIALHDTYCQNLNQEENEKDSYMFFKEVILEDKSCVLLEYADTLSVMQKKY